MTSHDSAVLQGLVRHLPYLQEEKNHAKRVLHSMEYYIWCDWRERWSRYEDPYKYASMQQAVLEVSERQWLIVPAVQEMVCYTERCVRRARRAR